MNMSGLLIALLLLIIQGSLAQRVRVDAEVESYPGQAVTLRCHFPNPGDTQLTQVSWIFEQTDVERTNIAVFHPNFGANYPDKSPLYGRVRFVTNPPTLENPSIQITDVKMTDEGRYICEYATYPSGNEQGVSSLVMLAKPKNMATTVTVTAGTTPVIVARCESSNGRPAATISWSTALNGNVSTPMKTNNADNTVTVQSTYMLAPQPADNGKDISCVVSHRTMSKPDTFPMKLVVEYPPQVQIVGYDNNWYRGRTSAFLTCQFDGNPHPTTVTWKTLSGLMPETVQVQENRLAVQKVDDTINTTFICEVRNSLGYARDQITVFVREQSPTSSNAGVIAGVIFACLLAIVLLSVLAYFLVAHNRRQQHGYRGTGKPTGAPYDSFTRLFGSAKSSKNGTGNNGNNNTPIYRGDVGLNEKTANQGMHPGGVALLETTRTHTAEDILLSREMDEVERKKFDELEEEDERYDHFSGAGPILQLRPHEDDIDDDMESQRDGSVISRTAVYV
ncbi:poliovirus receptor homolog isoform X1 [Pimephales promelas]|uniref:poliovirus receptor homolog isoform X1 n=1 Tax=Pimephales promelas TaxID=90988 RepID=UPI001955613A|nr:poliovirus receptor homolog isoform X1 [Pimephales promelas]KAG1947759.1 nectin-1 [Pimephales promelas]